MNIKGEAIDENFKNGAVILTGEFTLLQDYKTIRYIAKEKIIDV